MKFISIEKISSKESWNVIGILIGFIALGLFAVRYYPLDLLNKLFPGLFRVDSSCILLNVTGLPCPFCGMSRAFREFINLNFSKSIYYNPSSVIFFIFLGIICLSILVLSFFNYKISVSFNKKTFLILVMVLATMWTLNIMFGHH